MPIVASGQATIVDYNDAVHLTCRLDYGLSNVQVLNTSNSAYVPSWNLNNLVITPALFISGNAANIIANVLNGSDKWEIAQANAQGVMGAWSTTLPNGVSRLSSSPFTLTINQNLLDSSSPALALRFSCQYKDAVSNLTVDTFAMETFTLVTSGQGAVYALASAPEGMQFKSKTPDTLLARCDLYANGVVQSSGVTYQWFKRNSFVSSSTLAAQASGTSATLQNASWCRADDDIIFDPTGSPQTRTIQSVNGNIVTLKTALTGTVANGKGVQHAALDVDAGAGWQKLNASLVNYYSGGTSKDLTVYATFVDSQETFMCKATWDNHKYYASQLLFDTQDPVWCDVIASVEKFKGGEASSSVLTCTIYTSSGAISPSNTTELAKYNIYWNKYDKTGALVTGGGWPKSGGASTYRTLTVTDADVDVKATFVATVDKIA